MGRSANSYPPSAFDFFERVKWVSSPTTVTSRFRHQGAALVGYGAPDPSQGLLGQH